MEIIDNGIVFSEDINRILRGNNSLDFNYEKNGIIVPDKNYIEKIRLDFKKDVNKIFNNKTKFITEEEMLNSINNLTQNEKYPIVSLDKIYLTKKNNVTFLDCTRLNDSTKLVSRFNSNNLNSVDNQIKNISSVMNPNNKIILVDDVVFSGTVIQSIIDKFKKYNIEVLGIKCGISTKQSYINFNKSLPLGIKCGYLLNENVIDQICERDFYFGIVGSGISTLVGNKIYKSPYFKPFGNPVERASIPKKYENYFSKGCINRSLKLWKKIEDLSQREIYIKNLPEEIINTKKDETIVKTLKRGIKNI